MTTLLSKGYAMPTSSKQVGTRHRVQLYNGPHGVKNSVWTRFLYAQLLFLKVPTIGDLLLTYRRLHAEGIDRAILEDRGNDPPSKTRRHSLRASGFLPEVLTYLCLEAMATIL